MKNRAMEFASISSPIVIAAYGLISSSYILFSLSLCLAAAILMRIWFIREPVCPKLMVMSSLSLLIFSIVVSLFPYDTSMDRGLWAHSMGAVYWLITFPLAAFVLETMAVLTNARLNYPLVPGFMAFISGSLMTLAMVTVSYMEGTNNVTIASIDLLSVLFMNFVLSLFAAVILSLILKKNRFVLCSVKQETEQ